MITRKKVVVIRDEEALLKLMNDQLAPELRTALADMLAVCQAIQFVSDVELGSAVSADIIKAQVDDRLNADLGNEVAKFATTTVEDTWLSEG